VAIGVRIDDGREEARVGRHPREAGPFGETWGVREGCTGTDEPSGSVVSYVRGGRLELDPAWLPAPSGADTGFAPDRARVFLGGGRLYGLWRLGVDASGAPAIELRILRIRRGRGNYSVMRDAAEDGDWE